MTRKASPRAKAILKYTDSESNELMIGFLHMAILPFAMFELGKPWAILQIGRPFGRCLSSVLRLVGRTFQDAKGGRPNRLRYFDRHRGQLYHGRHDERSHLGWLLICGMSIWNLYRVTNEELSKG